MADLLNGLLDNTIGRIPGVDGSGAFSQIKGILDIPVKLGTDFAAMQINMVKSMSNLGLNLSNAAGKIANWLGDSLNSPLFMYALIGGGGLWALSIMNAPSNGGGGYSSLPSNAQTLSALASFTPIGKVARMI